MVRYQVLTKEERLRANWESLSGADERRKIKGKLGRYAEEVREAALRCLLVLTRDEEQGGNSGQLVKDDANMKQVLPKRIEEISSMAPEDLGVAREERQLVDSLWNTCYNEPSSLREMGLLVLLGEDAPGACCQ